ncbi:MAG: circadian clock protein KaiC [Aggregatilineales bacterium]
MPTGIVGFDEIANGGLPRNRTSLLIGAPGCGKTVFALQTLVNGARQWAEPGIFVAFEETSREIIENAATFGWDLPTLEEQELFFLDARMAPDMIQAGSFDLLGMLASLKAKADAMGARRIVFDSIDVLLALLDDRMAERRELYRVHDWLLESELSGIITARIDGVFPIIAQRYEFLQFMADCVVLMQHRVQDRLSVRDVRVEKYRGSAFAESEFPMLIDSTGVEVFGPGRIQAVYPASTERVSTGLSDLDSMLDGGYYRGTSILLTGAPGTGKSTLSGVFAEAACRRGETTVYVSFDEGTNEIIRHLSSIGVNLAPHIENGTLHMVWARQQLRSADAYLISLRKLIDEYKPRCVVIDPLSNMLRGGALQATLLVIERLIILTKAAGITVVLTSISPKTSSTLEATSTQIATLIDTWIQVSHVTQSAERKRLLTILKARGIHHSNRVRELTVSDQGITLTDITTADADDSLQTSDSSANMPGRESMEC